MVAKGGGEMMNNETWGGALLYANQDRLRQSREEITMGIFVVGNILAARWLSGE